LKTPGEKKARKTVVFTSFVEDSDDIRTPMKQKPKPARTPKPKARFADDYEFVETPAMAQEILKRKRRSSTKFITAVPATPPAKRRSRRSQLIDEIPYVDSPK
jgi:hypothetical protein